MYVLEHQMFEPPPAALTAQATAIQLPPATHAVPVLAAAAGGGSATMPKAKAASAAAVVVNPLMSAEGDFSEDESDAGNEERTLNTVFSKPATAVTETVPETPDLLIFDAMKDTVGRLKAYCDTINTAVADMLHDCAQSLLDININGTNLNDDILAHVATLQSDAGLILEAYDNISITDMPDMDKLLTAAGNAPLYLAKVMRYLSELVTDLLRADEDNARTAGEQLAGVQAKLKQATSDTEQATEELNGLRVRLSKLTTELKKIP